MGTTLPYIRRYFLAIEIANAWNELLDLCVQVVLRLLSLEKISTSSHANMQHTHTPLVLIILYLQMSISPSLCGTCSFAQGCPHSPAATLHQKGETTRCRDGNWTAATQPPPVPSIMRRQEKTTRIHTVSVSADEHLAQNKLRYPLRSAPASGGDETANNLQNTMAF